MVHPPGKPVRRRQHYRSRGYRSSAYRGHRRLLTIKSSEGTRADRGDARAKLPETLKALYERYRTLKEGRVADYIPELACANPDWFGISIVTTDGAVFDCGDWMQSFTIQSISKPLVYGLALEDRGRDYVLSRVGVEPSGEAFIPLSWMKAPTGPSIR